MEKRTIFSTNGAGKLGCLIPKKQFDSYFILNTKKEHKIDYRPKLRAKGHTVAQQ